MDSPSDSCGSSDTPLDALVLAPFILRELHYRLLQSESGSAAWHRSRLNGRLRRANAIAWIKALARSI